MNTRENRAGYARGPRAGAAARHIKNRSLIYNAGVRVRWHHNVLWHVRTRYAGRRGGGRAAGPRAPRARPAAPRARVLATARFRSPPLDPPPTPRPCNCTNIPESDRGVRARPATPMLSVAATRARPPRRAARPAGKRAPIAWALTCSFLDIPWRCPFDWLKASSSPPLPMTTTAGTPARRTLQPPSHARALARGREGARYARRCARCARLRGGRACQTRPPMHSCVLSARAAHSGSRAQRALSPPLALPHGNLGKSRVLSASRIDHTPYRRFSSAARLRGREKREKKSGQPPSLDRAGAATPARVSRRLRGEGAERGERGAIV